MRMSNIFLLKIKVVFITINIFVLISCSGCDKYLSFNAEFEGVTDTSIKANITDCNIILYPTGRYYQHKKWMDADETYINMVNGVVIRMKIPININEISKITYDNGTKLIDLNKTEFQVGMDDIVFYDNKPDKNKNYWSFIKNNNNTIIFIYLSSEDILKPNTKFEIITKKDKYCIKIQYTKMSDEEYEHKNKIELITVSSVWTVLFLILLINM